MRLDNVGSFFSTLLLILCGAIGVVIGVADMFGLELPFATADPLAILIALIGLIAVSLGVERAIEHRKLSLQIERLESSLAARVGGRVLNGFVEMEAAAIRSVEATSNSIRIIVHAASLEARAAFTQAVARRLRASKREGNPISVDVLYIVDPEPPAQLLDGMERRIAQYVGLGVADQFRLRVLETPDPTGIEMLLVDDQHSFLFFPVLHGAADIQKGLMFESQPLICRELTAWFERRIKDESEDLQAWLQATRARSASSIT